MTTPPKDLPPSRPPRKGRDREPPTIDLKATRTGEAEVFPAEPAGGVAPTGSPAGPAGPAAGPTGPASGPTGSASGPAGPAARPDLAPGSEPVLEPHGDPLLDAVAPGPQGSAPEAGPGRGATSDAAATAPPMSDAPIRAPETGPAIGAPEPGPAAAGRASNLSPASEPRRRGGFGSLLGAGLLGGLIGAGALFAADAWLNPPGDAPPGEALEGRVARLEQRAGGLAPSDAVQGLNQKVAALGSDLARLSERVRATETLAQASPPPSQNAASPPPAADNPALADLTSRLSALDAQMRDNAQVQVKRADIEGLVAPLREQVQVTGAAVQALESRLREQAQANAGALQALEARLREQAQASAQTSERRATEQDQRLAALDQRQAALDQRLAALARQVSDQGPAAAASLRIVLADRVARAVREGSPYAEGLAGLRRLGVEPARVQPLEPFATPGAPTAAALAREFKPLGDRIVQDARTPPANWRDSLWRMADQVVTVRPIQDAGSTSPASLVARIEDALSRGALKDAAAAWDALPEPARRMSEAWGQRLKQTIAADDAAQRLSTEALSALEASTRSRS